MKLPDDFKSHEGLFVQSKPMDKISKDALFVISEVITQVLQKSKRDSQPIDLVKVWQSADGNLRFQFAREAKALRLSHGQESTTAPRATPKESASTTARHKILNPSDL